MRINILKTKKDMALLASKKAADILKKSIKEKGKASFIAATGTTMFEFLENLTKDKSIDCSKVTMFHLDEYIGIDENHKASFRKFLKERIVDKVKLKEVNLINGSSKDAGAECERLGKIISKQKIDVCFCGIGENGHLGFNEPPADFEVKDPFIVVKLDKKTFDQQVKEGWFSNKKEVPKKAITMSIKQIMKSKNIILLVNGKRKAKITKDCFEKKISNKYPASILRKHKNCFAYLDEEAGSLVC